MKRCELLMRLRVLGHLLMSVCLAAALTQQARSEDSLIKPEVVFAGQHQAGITGLVWSNSDVDVIYSLDLSGVLVANRVGESRPLWTLRLDASDPANDGPLELRIHYVALARDAASTRLYVGDSRGSVTEVSAALGQKTGRSFLSSSQAADGIRSLATHPDQNILVAGTFNGSVHFWSLDNPGAPQFSVRAHEWPVRWLKMTASGEYVMSADPTRAVLWNTNTGRQVADLSTFLGHEFPGSFTFNSLATSAQDDSVLVHFKEGYRVYDLVTQQSAFRKWPLSDEPEDDSVQLMALSTDRRNLLLLVGQLFLILDPEDGGRKAGFLDFRTILPPQIHFVSQLEFQQGHPDTVASARTVMTIDIFSETIKTSHEIGVYRFSGLTP